MINNDTPFEMPLRWSVDVFIYVFFPLKQLRMYQFSPHKSGKTIPLPLSERAAPAVMPFSRHANGRRRIERL